MPPSNKTVLGQNITPEIYLHFFFFLLCNNFKCYNHNAEFQPKNLDNAILVGIYMYALSDVKNFSRGHFLFLYILQPLYKTIRYNTVLDITQFKDGSQKCVGYIEKMTINGHFSI